MVSLLKDMEGKTLIETTVLAKDNLLRLNFGVRSIYDIGVDENGKLYVVN
jgi:hypothetical protein